MNPATNPAVLTGGDRLSLTSDAANAVNAGRLARRPLWRHNTKQTRPLQTAIQLREPTPPQEEMRELPRPRPRTPPRPGCRHRRSPLELADPSPCPGRGPRRLDRGARLLRPARRPRAARRPV